MAKESKGQQVKTFKHFVPMPNLKSEETIGKVYFRADGGTFAIYLPGHIAAMAQALPDAGADYEAKGARFERGGLVSAPTLAAVMASYAAMLRNYKTTLQNQKREKVILVEFKSNIRHIKGFHDVRNSRNFVGYGSHRGDISFCGNPAVNLQYEVLWRVGDELYSLHHEGRDDEHLDYKSKVAIGTKVITWTKEREDFFAGVVGNIERLIMAMTEFLDDMEGNLTKAIAAGGQLPMLAGPKPTVQT